jgi:ribonuclease R
MGDKVCVKVVATNLDKRQIDYEWVITSTLKENEEPSLFTVVEEEAREKEKGRKKKKRKA